MKQARTSSGSRTILLTAPISWYRCPHLEFGSSGSFIHTSRMSWERAFGSQPKICQSAAFVISVMALLEPHCDASVSTVRVETGNAHDFNGSRGRGVCGRKICIQVLSGLEWQDRALLRTVRAFARSTRHRPVIQGIDTGQERDDHKHGRNHDSRISCCVRKEGRPGRRSTTKGMKKKSQRKKKERRGRERKCAAAMSDCSYILR